MSRVLLVCSVHGEMGLATATELHWLLCRLRPDVLFLEHSTADFSAFLDDSCGMLESAAVRRFRTRYDVELVPVDLAFQAAEAAAIKQTVDALFDRIEEASPRYCQLERANRYHTAKGGFAYLNSPTGALLQCEMQKEIRATVENVGEPTLAELYAYWTRTNERRELAMLTGVESFARQASFEKGVLLVGAAHRQPLLEKWQLARSSGRSPVTWDFDWHLDEAVLGGIAGPSDDQNAAPC